MPEPVDSGGFIFRVPFDATAIVKINSHQPQVIPPEDHRPPRHFYTMAALK
jgi:hypothetical protein